MPLGAVAVCLFRDLVRAVKEFAFRAELAVTQHCPYSKPQAVDKGRTIMCCFRSVICAVCVVALFPTHGVRASELGFVLYPMQPPTGYTSDAPYGDTQVASGGQVVGYANGKAGGGGYNQAVVWTSTGAAVDLTPTKLSGFTSSEGYATNGTQQVGYGDGSGDIDQALLWNGTGASAVNLNPTDYTGYTSSEAFGTNGTQQVGYAFGAGTGRSQHAMLWNGTSNSAVDLEPLGTYYNQSDAIATNGTQQVGDALVSSSPHAMIWNGSAGSYVDLNPTNLTGITNSYANALFGTKQVGYGYGTSVGNHALLWTGTAASVVDLNPTNLPGFLTSIANGNNATEQVGYGAGSATGNQNHALMWSGSASTAVDLQPLLPAAGSWTTSRAFTIDASGEAYGWAEGTYDGYTGYFATEWSVPEPRASLFALAALAILIRPAHRFRRKQAF
jgi:hypothetical protein